MINKYELIICFKNNLVTLKIYFFEKNDIELL